MGAPSTNSSRNIWRFALTFERAFGRFPVLPHVLCSPEPHHPDVVWSLAREEVAAWSRHSQSIVWIPTRSPTWSSLTSWFVVHAEIDRLEAEFAELAWVGHRRGIGAVDGSPSTQAWLRRHTGMREGDARAAIETGEVSELLPTIGAAWRDGGITTGAVRAITAARVDGHDLKLVAVEDVLYVLARADDQRELRRACTHFRNCAQADGTEPREHDGLTISTTYTGAKLIHAELSSSAAETVETAIHEYTDPPTDSDPRSAARRRADALVRMAELAIAQLNDAGADGPKRRARPRPASSSTGPPSPASSGDGSTVSSPAPSTPPTSHACCATAR